MRTWPRIAGSAVSPARANNSTTRGRTIWLEQFAQDLRYAWRGLWQSPTFVATTVLTLAVGMSLVTVVFAIFNAYVLRPFAVRDPYDLYAIGWRSQEAGGSTFRWRDYEEIRTRDDLFDGMVGEATARQDLGGGAAAPRRVRNRRLLRDAWPPRPPGPRPDG